MKIPVSPPNFKKSMVELMKNASAMNAFKKTGNGGVDIH